jgi:xanthine dehydrogenase accessory factor
MKFIYEQLLEGISAGEKLVLITLVSADEGFLPAAGAKRLWSAGRVAGTLGVDWLDREADSLAGRVIKTGQAETACIASPGRPAGQCAIVAEPFFKPEELLILGGGNIARPLVRVASVLGYSITVVDDRPEFADPARFPEAGQVVCSDFERFLNDIDAGPWTSAVIVTRGHQHDLACMRRLIGRDLAYLGMIGSRHKIRQVKEHLIASGVDEGRIDRVYMPVGLDIGAQTPEEIAVSIAAELVKVRRSGAARSLAEEAGGGKPAREHAGRITLMAQDVDLLKTLVDYANKGIPMALATVTATRGSTPRKAGARMLIFRDGSILGTIGGGVTEDGVIRKGLGILAGSPAGLYKFSLDNKLAALAGAVCGGYMEVFIEPVEKG